MMKHHNDTRDLNVTQIDPCPLPFCASRDDKAPVFSAEAFLNGQIQTLKLEEMRGKWLIVFFYASNFTFVWPTELAAVADLYPQFRNINADVWGISTDSVYSHKVFKEISPSANKVQFPLLSDRNHRISRAYRVLDENSGSSYRATIVIDPEGIIVSKLIYPREVGRNSFEILRLLQGIQYGRQTQLGVPANWVPGMTGIELRSNDIGRV
jgi:NADH-dependent peroxiredoxin subunit C